MCFFSTGKCKTNRWFSTNSLRTSAIPKTWATLGDIGLIHHTLALKRGRQIAQDMYNLFPFRSIKWFPRIRRVFLPTWNPKTTSFKQMERVKKITPIFPWSRFGSSSTITAKPFQFAYGFTRWAPTKWSYNSKGYNPKLPILFSAIDRG